MIHLNCPNCGRRGSVPEAKRYARLHCVKCDAVFHVATNGQVMLGEPGKGKPAKLGDPNRSLEETEASQEDPIELITQLPWPLLVVFVVALAVGLGWVLGLWTPG
jgi:hypothetical protein